MKMTNRTGTLFKEININVLALQMKNFFAN